MKVTYRHTTRSCVVPSICIAYTSHLQAIYAQLPAFLSSVLEKLAWVSSIKTANQPSRVRFRRGDRRIFHPFAGLRAELLQYSFQAPRNACGSEAQLRAARSQARALATAAAPRPVVFFSPPSIPARHTSHLSRPSCSNKHHLPAGVHILRHVWFDIPLTLSYLRASCTVPRFCGLISSHLVHPICDSPASGGCRVAPRSA